MRFGGKSALFANRFPFDGRVGLVERKVIFDLERHNTGGSKAVRGLHVHSHANQPAHCHQNTVMRGHGY